MGNQEIISCRHCGVRYRIDGAKVPDTGKKLKCRKCAKSFTVMKPDDHYRESYSTEIAAYLIHRKEIGDASNVRFDLKRISVLEKFLANRQKRIGDADGDDLDQFDALDRKSVV